MGPIKNPCCGEAKRERRNGGGGGKKKEKRRKRENEKNRRSRKRVGSRARGVREEKERMRRTGCDGGGKRTGGRWTCLEGEEGCSPFLFVFQKLGTPFRVVDHLIAPVRLANKLTIDPLANYVPARETRIAVDRFLRSLPPALSSLSLSGRR